MSPELLHQAQQALPHLPEPVQQKVGALIAEARRAKAKEVSQSDFMAYVNYVWPTFIHGRHHEKMARAFEKVAEGRTKRLIINMPPRHTKSEFASYLLPSWFLGKFPQKKVIQTSHTAELAVGFGRKVRNLVDSDRYKDLFPDVALQVDSKAAGRWATNYSGEYFAIGVGGAVTGKGADLLIIDDPHSEQEAALAEVNSEIYDKTYEWYTSGPRQRLQPGGAIVIVMTRWSKKDLTGQVLKSSAQRGGDEWEVIEFPALFEDYSPPRPLWPEFWSVKELMALKEELPNSKWMAQYQQNPTSESSAIVKREWWQIWEDDEPPYCEFTLMAWDTAFEKTNRADYSACTLWGIFYQPDENGVDQANIILLNAFRDRMEFPTLKRRAIEEYQEWNPDSIIIEKKASGAPLIYEMRAMGIPVQEYTPVKGNDKISRLNSVSDLFASKRIWAPNTAWAEEVIDEVASFPAGEHDDYVDSTTLALMRFRRGGFIRTTLDEEEEPQFFRRRAEPYY
jgi:predicted phage terminase large subunit-like protein